MYRTQVLLVSFSFESLSDLVNVRKEIRFTNKKERLNMAVINYEFENLKSIYEEGFGNNGKIVNGFLKKICGGAFLTKKEIKTIEDWDTNLLIFNMHNGHEYL